MLRVELEAWDGRTAWAEYDTFRLVSRNFNFTKINFDLELRERTRDTNSTLEDTKALLVTAWLATMV